MLIVIVNNMTLLYMLEGIKKAIVNFLNRLNCKSKCCVVNVSVDINDPECVHIKEPKEVVL